MRGYVHNAKKCTFDGRDLWIASICDDKGHFSCRSELISEHETREAAYQWLNHMARRLDLGKMLIIEEST
jgi:hypothetical protein